jgi:hypothetical protein
MRSRFENYLTFKFIYDLVNNGQTQTYSVLVDIILLLNKSKQLEELVLVLQLNPNSSILNRNFEKLLVLLRNEVLLFNDFNINRNAPFLSKFNSVGHQTEKNLHHPLFVGVNHWNYTATELIDHIPLVIFFFNIYEIHRNGNPGVIRLFLHNSHNFIDGFHNIKQTKILPKFLSIDLCIV